MKNLKSHRAPVLILGPAGQNVKITRLKSGRATKKTEVKRFNLIRWTALQ